MSVGEIDRNIVNETTHLESTNVSENQKYCSDNIDMVRELFCWYVLA